MWSVLVWSVLVWRCACVECACVECVHVLYYVCAHTKLTHTLRTLLYIDTDVVRALNFDNSKELSSKCTLYMQFSNNGEDFTVSQSKRGESVGSMTMYLHHLQVLPSGTSLRQICDNVCMLCMVAIVTHYPAPPPIQYWTPGEKLKLYFSLDGALTS